MRGAEVVRVHLDIAEGGDVSFAAAEVVTTLPNPALTWPVTSRSFRLRDVTDSDGDGRLDLLTEAIEVQSERMNPTTSSVKLMLDDGAGGFSGVVVAGGYGYEGSVYGDWVLQRL